ncbi:phytoene desaturase family protein [Botrimarina hoheduenensis]|uniref:Diapolycopene oxygenase n=1 Tax=Botrimarina hoheduenensis TaxID=2528000 RepID=A0A5C5VYN1_9BACT|nr:phytoene desaturase family protein [Botrimarina hoheduenensis]TWT43145.1 Diapolycopene oxygenase [Botrimarina hoheduenensis]
MIASAKPNGSTRVAVVGGGLGGLAAACTLAARGYKVALFERNATVGGKAVQLRREGYRFDMGPTILTLPSVLRRIFAEAGHNLDDRLELVRLDPQWRCFFEDRSVLDLVADIPAMKQTLQAFSGDPAVGAGYEKFLATSKRLHEISDRFFFWKSVGGIVDTMDVGGTFNAKVLGDLLQLRMGQTVAGTVRSHVPDERVAQMIDHFTQYVGSSPEASPAVLCGIAHMQTEEGVWYPMQGTRAVPEALAKLAAELDIEVHTETPVRRIVVENGRAVGIETEAGERHAADAVVSNCDSVLTHRELLGEGPRSPFLKRRKYEPACSGVVLYLGLNRRYEQLLHHNFIFSEDPHIEFDAIYNRGVPAPDPTAYVCAPAITEPGVAPDGGEALYILVHTPYRRDGQDWSQMLPAYRETILDKLERTAGMENLRDAIVVEASLTPADIESRYNVLRGAIYGLASHGRFFGAFKPANRSRDVKGLYLAGGAAHPGPGMPMVLMSGWIAADSLDADYERVGEHATASV